MHFRHYMEALADFGIDRRRSRPVPSDRPEKENPINPFNIEYMRDMLLERELGELRPVSRFVDEVVWGQGAGSIRLLVDPKTGVYMDRLGTDLGGTPRWYTKKYVQINREGFGGYEETVTNDLFDYLEGIEREPIDSPRSDYKGLRLLAVNMADRVRKESTPIFLFDKIKKMNEDRYLLCSNVRGQGVQAPGQTRVEMNVTDLNYYPQEGYIRVINNAYESPLSGHTWEVAGPDFDLTFFPTQPRDEIISPVCTNLRFY